MVAILLLSQLLAAGPSNAANSADVAYAQAKNAYQRLRVDKNRRKYRHNWQRIARNLEDVAKEFPKSPRAAEATYSSAQLNGELSRFSDRDEDLGKAVGNFETFLARWPRHTLAPKAALALAKLYADRQDQPQKAREVLEKALSSPGSEAVAMRRMLLLLPPPKPKAVATKPKAPKSTAMPMSLQEAIAKVGVRSTHAAPEVAELALATTPESWRFPARTLAEAPPISGAATVARDDLPGEEELGAVPKGKSPRVDMKSVNDLVPIGQQLGLKIRRVVLDPGHGGHDPGSIGRKGTRESTVTLAIAKKLAARLEARGLQVVLTRDDDSYVKLEDRTRKANSVKGDLFVSIHCNAAPSKKLQGIETYTLNTSANRYSIRLAAQENATSEAGVSDLQYILADLTAKANTSESVQLAKGVQRSLVRTARNAYPNIVDHGTKEALFFVLLGAKMPSILIETAFLSNPEEEQRLRSARYQDLVAKAIADGIQDFLEVRTQMASVR